jgi:hypothetical protein
MLKTLALLAITGNLQLSETHVTASLPTNRVSPAIERGEFLELPGSSPIQYLFEDTPAALIGQRPGTPHYALH